MRTVIRISLIAVFASMQAVLCSLPFTITIGVSGQITLGLIGAPITGILLGPLTGGSAALIGSLIGAFINPAGAIFGPLSIIPPSMGAFAAGCVKIKKGYVAGATMLAALAIFYVNPVGSQLILYPWIPIVAIIAAFSPLATVAGATLASPGTVKPVFGIVLAAFIGVLADYSAGIAIAIWYYPFVEIWYAIMFVYPIERIVATIIVSVIAVPLYYALQRSGMIETIENVSRKKPIEPQ